MSEPDASKNHAAPAPSAPKSTPLGLYDKPGAARITVIEVIAIALSLLWLLGAVVFFVVVPSEPGLQNLDSLRFLVTMLAVFMPVAMIWVAATAARSSRVMREESARLQTAIDAIRQSYISQNQSRGMTAETALARRLDEIAAATRKTETALASMGAQRGDQSPRSSQPASQPGAVAASAPDADQPALELGTQAEDLGPPLASEDFIRALNFPETAEDEEGFAALRRALKNRMAAQLIQAAQDVLTLLSQDGVYMDDLRPDLARPELWREFAQGKRGKEMAALGGVRDRTSLTLAAGRMKQDPIFRDAAHHFLRRFDKSIAAFEPGASDSELTALAETRTARAFMLLARVAGTFD